MAKKVEIMCSKCGYLALYEGFDSQKFCPQDGERLRDFTSVTDEDGTEIFLHKFKGENITAFGYHFKCGGYIYERTSSDDRRVLTCKACCLRTKMPAWGSSSVTAP